MPRSLIGRASTGHPIGDGVAPFLKYGDVVSPNRGFSFSTKANVLAKPSISLGRHLPCAVPVGLGIKRDEISVGPKVAPSFSGRWVRQRSHIGSAKESLGELLPVLGNLVPRLCVLIQQHLLELVIPRRIAE
jgi:hypothetical protein